MNAFATHAAIVMLAAGAFTVGSSVWESTPAVAVDRIKLTATRRGSWDSSVAEIGQRLGIMARNGVELDINYVWTSPDILKAVTSDRAEIGVAADLADVLAAFAKQRSLRVVANQSAGAHDFYWYVRADSSISSWSDTAGRTLAYSTECCTRSIVGALMRERHLKARPVATGWASPTLTQVLTRQIDIGWATPPFGLEHIDSGEIRVLAHGSETEFGQRTLRVVIADASMLSERPDVLARFGRAWRQSVAAMYEDPKALAVYAGWRRIELKKARRLRDEFFPQASLDPDRIVGLKAAIAEAVATKTLTRSFSGLDMEELIKPLPK